MSDADALAQLLAKQEIYELSCRYMRGLDRLDLSLLTGVFHDDAQVDYGFFQGAAREFIGFAKQALEAHLANHHMIGQVHTEVSGDRAQGEVYFQAFHRTVDDGREEDLFIAGRYVDRYERRDGVWKIAFRSEINDWASTRPAADLFFQNTPGSLRGGRLDDWSYRRSEIDPGASR